MRASGEVALGYADFLSRVAHDLRSPLGVVLHVVQQLEADFDPQLGEEHRVLLKLGKRGLRRLQGFVERMRLLSDLEAGKLQPAFQRVDVARVVQHGIDATVAAEPRSEIAVGFEPPQSPVFTSGDPRLLGHLVSELVSNALIHAKRRVLAGVEVDAARREAVVSIEDDGAGVPDAVRDTMFERFVVRPTRGGLGVGLSIAQDIAELHGGHLRFSESRLPPGRPGTTGARFQFTLPIEAFTSAASVTET
jgi:signal transduction histidine kinase